MSERMKKAISFLFRALPGVFFYFVLSAKGFLFIGFAILAEFACILVDQKFFLRKPAVHGQRMVTLCVSTVGIVAGYGSFPVAPKPFALGVAALIITVAIHSILCLIAFTIARRIVR